MKAKSRPAERIGLMKQPSAKDEACWLRREPSFDVILSLVSEELPRRAYAILRIA
jgi:hypothetical protein